MFGLINFLLEQTGVDHGFYVKRSNNSYLARKSH